MYLYYVGLVGEKDDDNGKMLNNFVEWNEWIVASGEDTCTGRWTRIVGNST